MTGSSGSDQLLKRKIRVTESYTNLGGRGDSHMKIMVMLITLPWCVNHRFGPHQEVQDEQPQYEDHKGAVEIIHKECSSLI